jgi:hypothetical protein
VKVMRAVCPALRLVLLLVMLRVGGFMSVTYQTYRDLLMMRLHKYSGSGGSPDDPAAA